MTAYQKMKEKVKEATDQQLKDMYLILGDYENMEAPEIATRMAIEGELERRGMVELDEETYEYRFVR